MPAAAKIAAPAGTKAKIISDQNPPDIKPLLKDPHNEILSAYPREIEIESAYLHPIHSRRRQQLQFFAQSW